MGLMQDLMYVDRVMPYVQRFKAHGNNRWNFRCPYCGDSKRENKARGWIFKNSNIDSLLYNCFNCGVSTTFGNLIKHLDIVLYNEYKFSEYREKSIKRDEPISNSFFTDTSKELIITDSALDTLQCVSELPDNHYAVQYLFDRKIPTNLWNLFYFTNEFKKYTNSLIPGKFETLERDHPRLVMPFWNEHGKMFAFAGRALHGEEPKYFTIKLDEEEEKIYGRERLDYSKPIIVVEGQIDSILLPNAISVSGSSFDTPYIRGIKTNCLLVPDNEPRNPQITKLYSKYIKAGYRVCMLPDTFTFKDINEAIIGGMTSEQIAKIIDDNSYQGLSAEAKFMSWNKCNTSKPNKTATNLTNISKLLQNSIAFK